MSDAILAAVQKSQLKPKAEVPAFSVGDTVDVHVRIIEGSKERIQVFTGVVIKQQNGGLEETFTVRRIVANEGVERTFPVHSPRVAKIEVKRRGDARRAKLYYLRDRVGKKRRLRDRRRGMHHELVVPGEKQVAPANAAELDAAKQDQATADEA
jgi:large subunit ribosomal protein L19